MIRPTARLLPGPILLIGLASTSAARQGTPPGAKAEPAPAVDLSTYVPNLNVCIYAECDGFQARHRDAWTGTAAYKILAETSTGAMLDDLAPQAFDRWRQIAKARLTAAGQPVTGLSKASASDAVAAAKHLWNSGFVLASIVDPKEPAAPCDLLAIRGAGKKGVSEPFIRILGGSATPSSKFGIQEKRGRKVVIVDDPKSKGVVRQWGWWVEKNGDLVYTSNIGWFDRIVDAAEGKAQDARANPLVAKLIAADGAVAPIVRAMIDQQLVARLNAESGGRLTQTAIGREMDLKRQEIRVGIDGPALQTSLRLVIPQPRSGLTALIDQPTFGPKDLPTAPASATNVQVVSMNLATTFDRIAKLAQESPGGPAAMIDMATAAVKEKTKLNLRDEILAKLGPKFSIIRMASPAGRLPRFGFSVPKVAVLLESPDPATSDRLVDQLMTAANRELKASAPSLPDPDSEKGGAQPKRGEPKKKAAKAPTPEFVMIVPTPKTYILRLPPAFAALTNLALTVVAGKKGIIVAGDPASANDLQKATKDDVWKPDPAVQGALDALSKNLIYLGVDDPRDSLPQAIRTFPEILATLMTAAGRPAPIPGMPSPGAAPPPPGAPPTAGGQTPPPGMQRYGQGITFLPTGGMMGSNPGAPGPDASAPAPASPPPMMAPPLPPVTFKVDPAKLPSPESIRPLLFSGLSSISIDPDGIVITGRSAFPDISNLSIVLNPQVRAALGMGPSVGGLAGAPPPPTGGTPAAGQPRPGANFGTATIGGGAPTPAPSRGGGRPTAERPD